MVSFLNHEIQCKINVFWLLLEPFNFFCTLSVL